MTCLDHPGLTLPSCGLTSAWGYLIFDWERKTRLAQWPALWLIRKGTAVRPSLLSCPSVCSPPTGLPQVFQKSQPGYIRTRGTDTPLGASLKQLVPGGPVVKNLPADAGYLGLIPGLGRFYMPQSNQVCEPQLLSPHSRAHAMQQETPPQ